MTLYTIVYRKGGGVRFQWRRSLAQVTLEAAIGLLKATRSMGVEAHAVSHPERVAVPLPGVFTLRYKPQGEVWSLSEWEDMLAADIRAITPPAQKRTESSDPE